MLFPVSRKLSLSVLAVTLAVLCVPASAQYKWRDKNGAVQYSDMPPPQGTPEKDVLQQPSSAPRKAAAPTLPASSAAPASGATVSATPLKGGEPELEAKRKKMEADQAAKTKADAKAEDDKQAAARAENCTRAKAYQRTLDEGTRISRTDAKGEREILDDKGRAEENRRVKNIITSDCK
jgi:hypothetical protein